ncbi:glutamine synthetase family protein [Streptomyces sp. HU2014]|uniref:glutamine synthetase family protein n=1 Tax=Streptomyces sp. HU2014 TaxID=2939414 RepID=UPI00200F2100|nr:glutamine synthetase family protein [Streptomyces sp. HU2014]UQI45569.1 glutamine synthetase family protein [Streptomyces sp. HU2014]
MTDTPHPAAPRDYAHMSTGSRDFIARHGLWDDRREEAAAELEAALESLDFVRLVFADPHGLARSKTLTADAFRTVLRNGMDHSPGPFVFDTGHATAVDFTVAGGGIGVDELLGAGDFVLVPDPLTFRRLPYTGPRTGWVIGDEYLRSGAPHPLSGRAVLRRLCAGLRDRGQDYVVGLEVEWYLTRLTGEHFSGRPGGFGVQGHPPAVEPVNGGYQFNLDGLVDALEPVLAPLTRSLTGLGLPLRSVEHESGPGQLEFTFAPQSALDAADSMLLFRTATKQICARLGHHASFMALPGIPGFDASGWHLHQSLARAGTGENLFTSPDGADVLSETGRRFLAGLLDHAADAALLCVPTVNGYRRMNGCFSLAPSRRAWSVESRGAFLRVLGAHGDPATHIENRMGEPCANPYLYLAGQLAAGLDGVGRALAPGEPAADPYDSALPALPSSLREARDALAASDFYRGVLGAPLVDCLLRLKTSELRRYTAWQAGTAQGDEAHVSEWEHREYFATY